MADIDNLQIKISAEANSASKSLDGLSQKLGSLASSLRGVNTSGIKSFANAMNTLTNAMKGIKDVNASQFTKVAKGISKFGQIDAVKIASVSSAMRPLAQSINTLNGLTFDSTNISSFINSLAKLSNANVSSLNTVNFTQLGNSIRSMATALAGAPEVSRNTISFTSSVAKLGESGATIGYVSAELPRLGATLRQFIADMSTVSNVSEPTIQFTNSIGQLASAGARTKATATNLRKLSVELYKFFQVMSQAPQVSQNTIRMTEALSRLNSQSIRFNTSSRGVASVLNNFSLGANRASKSAKGLASSFGMFYAKFWLLLRAVRGIGKIINISSALTEVQNVVDVAFGRVAKDMDDFAENIAMTDFGLSELQAKEIGSRYQAMGNAIRISSDSLLQANTYLESVTGGYVKATNSASDMSITLTKLAADMASFYNVEQEAVAEDLQAVYTGMVRPLRKYGLDLTNATLQEWALSQGMQVNMKTMTQAEKTMLRYQYVLANTTNAQGDYLRTIDTWANRIRLLKNQFQQLGTIVGSSFVNALKPALRALNAVMDEVIQFARVVSNALGKIFGWTYEEGGGGISDEFGDASDYADDLASGLGDATDNAKKLKQQLQGIDELNVLTTSDNGKGSGGGLSDAVSGGLSEVSQGQWVKDESFYDSFIDNLYELGEYIGSSITDSLTSIDWDSVYASARGFGAGLADFLNGLISPELFGAVATTIAGSLNTALYSLNSFGTTFDWEDFGNSFATGINNFFATFDFANAAQTFNHIAKGILNGLIVALDNVDWELVGASIGEFIANLDFVDIALKLGTVAIKIVEGLAEAILNSASEAPLETAIITIFGGLALLNAGRSWALSIGARISSLLGISVSQNSAIGGATAGSGLLSGISAYLSTDVAKASLGQIGIAIVAGLGLGTAISDYLNKNVFANLADYLGDEELADYYKEYSNPLKSLPELGGMLYEEASDAIDKFATGGTLVSGFTRTTHMINANFSKMESSSKKTGKSIFSTFKKVGNTMEAFGVNTGAIKDAFGDFGEKVTKTGDIVGATTTLIDRTTSIASKGISDNIQNTKGIFASAIGSMVDTARNRFSEYKNNTINTFDIVGKSAVASTDSLRKNVESSYSTLKNNVSNIVSSSSGDTISKFKTATDSVSKYTIDFKNNSISKFKDTADSVSNITSSLKNDTISKFKTTKDDSINHSKNLKDSVSKNYSDLLTSVGKSVGSIRTNTVDEFSKIPNGVSSSLSSLGSIVSNGVGSATNILSNTSWYGSGTNLVNGLKNGISDKWSGTNNNSLVSKVVSLASTLTSSLKKAFGIHSPSKIWRDDIGVYLSEGLSLGISDGEDYVTKSIYGLADDMNKAMSGISVVNPLEDIVHSSYKANVGVVGSLNKNSLNGITENVSVGISQAMSASQEEQNELLREQNSLLMDILNKETGITSSDVFKAVRNENRRYYNQTGKNALAY